MNVSTQSRVIFEYMRLFFKMTLSNKITFFWSLFLPIVIFLMSRYPWLWNPPSLDEFYFQVSVFIAYIVFVLSIDTAIQLIRLRENGSMKVFKFISGSKYTVIWAQIFNQLITLIATSFLFSTVIGILFIHQSVEVMLFILISILVSVLIAPILCLFFLWLMVLPIKQESLVTVLNIVLLVFFLISANNLSLPTSLGMVTFWINPLEVVREAVFWLTNYIAGTSIKTHSLLLTILILCIYAIVGIFSMRATPIVSQTQRT